MFAVSQLEALGGIIMYEQKFRDMQIIKYLSAMKQLKQYVNSGL